jgi:bacterioferritin-associated ferredoxin
MYICLCRVVTRKVIEAVIEGGSRTVEEVGRRSGAGTDCGKCQRSIERLLQLEAQNREASQPASQRTALAVEG